MKKIEFFSLLPAQEKEREKALGERIVVSWHVSWQLRSEGDQLEAWIWMTSILPRVREGGSEQMVGVSEDMATSQVSFPTEIEYEAKSMNRCRGRSRFSTS